MDGAASGLRLCEGVCCPLATGGLQGVRHPQFEDSAEVTLEKTMQQREVIPLEKMGQGETQDPSPTSGPVPLSGGGREDVDIDQFRPTQICSSRFSFQISR